MTPANRPGRAWPLLLVHVGCLLPAAQIAYWWASGRMAINPIQDLTFATGLPALALLVLTLAVTPAQTLFGWRWAQPWRKWLGLYAFFYAFGHMLIFVVVDYGLDLPELYRQLIQKQYLLAGAGALLLLIPLALTSTRGWQKRLGRAWKDLHRVVYLAAGLAVLHFAWLVKADLTQPGAFGAALALLLALRIPRVRRWVSGLRQRLGRPAAQPPADAP